MRLRSVCSPGESGTPLDIGHDSCLAAGCGHWRDIYGINEEQWGRMGVHGGWTRSLTCESGRDVPSGGKGRRIQLFSCGSTSTL